MKRTPLRPRSAKRQAIYVQRRELVGQMLASFPFCQRCKTKPSQDVHEIKTRARGGSITDPANLAVLCRSCHDWITQNPRQAREDGWLKHSWE